MITQFGMKCNCFFCSLTTRFGQKRGYFYGNANSIWASCNPVFYEYWCVFPSDVWAPPSSILPAVVSVSTPPAHFSIYFMCGHDSVFYFPLTAVPCDQPYRSHPIFYHAPHFPLLHLAGEPPLNSYWLASTDYLFATSS